MDRSDNRWSVAVKLALMAALFTPVTIMIHEFGHLMIPLVFGLPAELHPVSVSGGAGASDPIWMQAAQAGGGPLLTLVMASAARRCSGGQAACGGSPSQPRPPAGS